MQKIPHKRPDELDPDERNCWMLGGLHTLSSNNARLMHGNEMIAGFSIHAEAKQPPHDTMNCSATCICFCAWCKAKPIQAVT